MQVRALLPPLIAFLLSATTMAAELVAPRRVAPALGTSSVVWAGVIGAFLLGLALGYVVGGRLADRCGAGRTFGRRAWLPLGLSAVAAATWVGCTIAPSASLFGASPLGAVFTLLLAYAPIAFVLGLPMPALTRAALAFDRPAGRTLGEMAAAGAFGSVVGTFAAGFWLIPALPLSEIATLLATVVVLLAFASLLLPASRRQGTAPPHPEPTVSDDPPTPVPAPLALATLAGGALLGVEMLAGRMASATLGTSLYSWTAVIGVTLTGLAIGNGLGGWLSDRRTPRVVLGRALLFASVAVTTGLWAPAVMLAAQESSLPWALRVLLGVGGGFLLPSIAIGVLTPAITRALLRSPEQDGRIVGRVTALATIGALLAAVLVPQVLVPMVGVPASLLLIAVALLTAAERVRKKRELPLLATLLVLLVLATAPFDAARRIGGQLLLRSDSDALYADDSPYFHIAVEAEPTRWVHMSRPIDLSGLAADGEIARHIAWDATRKRLGWTGVMSAEARERLRSRVTEAADRQALALLAERTRRPVRILGLDRLVHGFVDLEDPTWLAYDYELLYAAAVDTLWPTEGEVHCFFIGGGSYTFQRRQLAMAPEQARIVSSEIDPAVTRAAERALGLTPHRHHRIVHGDARAVLQRERERRRAAGSARFDFIFGDAFHDVGIPWHLTTREFAEQIRLSMHPERGVYLLNVVDVFEIGHFLAAQLRTLRAVFPYVTLRSVGPRRDANQETFLVVAAGRPVELGTPVLENGLPLPVVTYGEVEIDRLIERTRAPILTDDHAPVEALLAPVVARRASGDER